MPRRGLAAAHLCGQEVSFSEERQNVEALFIGQTYIDVTFLTDHLPTGDEKHVASAYAVSFGGNAVTAAFCCAKLAIVPELITSVADDWLGRMFIDMASNYAIPIHPRLVRSSSLSFIMPKEGKSAIVRCRDDRYLNSFPILDLTGCRVLHVDGHQPDAALWYAKKCRAEGILTSLAGRSLRPPEGLGLVWGLRSQALIHGTLHFLPSFIPVSLFDLESRFFAPTHRCWRPSRTGAVKVGRRSALAARSVVSRPRLDSPEHGGTLIGVGMTHPRGARCRGTRDSRRNLVSGGSH